MSEAKGGCLVAGEGFQRSLFSARDEPFRGASPDSKRRGEELPGRRPERDAQSETAPTRQLAQRAPPEAVYRRPEGPEALRAGGPKKIVENNKRISGEFRGCL